MNTGQVAKQLGVSPSTVQRWVKQLELDMERNELGHFWFTDEDLEIFKDIHQQLHSGIGIQDVKVPGKKARVGKVKSSDPKSIDDKLLERIEELEKRLDQKADAVVSYQLLTHRREIEDLEKEVANLTKKIEMLEKNKEEQASMNHPLVFDQKKKKKRPLKKNIISMFFGF
ncbi:MerR family transcriptional regulator [Falsibacillus albus]|uniref:Chromosome-anchoring protein RacA n=1 Tax=Falsibacillus albus TaxID=2478915 RepID=A0A3L7JSE0_9BACI|nr:MerR family transcriptional regulator [Falsibacillus albus]RLQ93797.1 MerR family transcriptional regulator [Falsibacillus albus]